MSDKEIGREIGQALGGHLSRRSLFALGGAAAVTGALAACGSNTGREPAATGGATGGGSGATLNQWYHQYGEAGTQQAVERYAAAYKDATVKVRRKPGDYDQSTAASLLTDAGPDVFEYGNGPTIDMIKGGQVVDLTDLIGDTKSDLNPSILERMTYEGKTYAIPQVVDMRLLVYRKSMLDKAGITPPQTIDEAHRRGEEGDPGQRQGPLPRQRRRRRPHGRPDAVVGRARLPHQGQPVRLRRPTRGDRPRQGSARCGTPRCCSSGRPRTGSTRRP